MEAGRVCVYLLYRIYISEHFRYSSTPVVGKAGSAVGPIGAKLDPFSMILYCTQSKF